MPDLPPLPPGLTLDQTASAAPTEKNALPPLPPGLTMEDPHAAPAAAPTAAGRIAQPLTDFPKEYDTARREAVESGRQAINDMFEKQGMLSKGLAGLEAVGSGLDYVTSPIKAAGRTFLGDPIERTTGIKGASEFTGNLAGQAAQQAAMLPRVDKLGTAAKAAKESAVGDSILKGISPTSRGEEAKNTELIIRANNGELAAAREQTAHNMEQYRSTMAKVPFGEVTADASGKAVPTPNSRLAFIDAIERGGATGTTKVMRPVGSIDEVLDGPTQLLRPNNTPLKGHVDFNAGKITFRWGTRPADAIDLDQDFFLNGGRLEQETTKMGKPGSPNLPEAMQPTAKFLRDNLDFWRDKVQGMGKGYLEHANADYFPHIWQSPKAQVDSVKAALDAEHAKNLSKAPLRGNKNFMQHRTIDSTVEGVARGLKPVSDNPLDIALLRINGLQKFYYGHQMFDELKAKDMVKFANSADNAPSGWVRLDGNEFSVFAPRRNEEATKELIKKYGPDVMKEINKAGMGIGSQMVGHYYAPPQVADILKGYLSQGLRGGGLYDNIRAAGNALNQAQLAIPGYHLMFTTQDTMVSEMARAVDRAAHGEWGKAAASFGRAHTPTTAIWTAKRGSALREAYLDPSKASPEMKPIVEMLKQGGGRVKMDSFYGATEAGSFTKSLKNGTFGQEVFGELKNRPLTALPRLVGRTIETMADPIMGYVVPRQKLGVFYNMAEDWLRRNPNASQDEVRAASTKMWDSVDNRMGQMVYDNIFWKKTMKDLAFLGVRSVGWNLGTMRELGGGAVDTTKAAYDAFTGKNPELTHRMAYSFALPYVVGIQGAAMTYLFTGHGPQHMIDYFAPPTGGTTAYGAPERVLIPSYMKDALEYNLAPAGTVMAKIHPLAETIRELYNNRDFYGAMIADSYDPGTQQLADYMKYFGEQVEPFSVRQSAKAATNPKSSIPSALPMIGITAAPIQITSPEQLRQIEETSPEAKAARRKKHRNDSK